MFVHDYKIPTSVEDIKTYLNQTTPIVSPLLERMGEYRKIIKQDSDNALDVFDDEASIRYK